MRLASVSVLLAAALMVMLNFGGSAPAAAAPARDWSRAIALTPAGGHLLGNPAAPVKVVEYVSYTCPHCAAFQRASEAPLKLGYLSGGKVSVEVRSLVRDPVDLAAALLANCGPPDRFPGNHSAFLARQAEWMKVVEGATDAQRQRWNTGAPGARMQAIASDLGFYKLVAQRGYTRAVADRCLADPALTKRIVAQKQGAIDIGVEGTPGFLLNGMLLAGTYDWPTLETQIKARL